MIIIDTYNCLHSAAAMPGSLTGLSLSELCRFLENARMPAVLVMDGRPKPEEPGENDFPTLRLVYSGRAATADDVIARLVHESTGRRHLTVVSNDHAVAGAARRAGARSLSCEAFLSRIMRARAARRGRRANEPSEKFDGLAASGQAGAWLKEFGFAPPSPPPPSSAEMDPDSIDMDDFLR